MLELPQVVGTAPGGRRCGRAAAAALLLGGLLLVAAPPAGAEVITSTHLDAGRIQFSGMDFNGDKLPDSIIQDNIRKTLFWYLRDERQNLRQIDPLTLPEEEQRLLPDALSERDLDGDEVRDLLLYNRDYLRKYRDNAPVFSRLVAASVYIGQPGDSFRDLGGCELTPEAREAVLQKAAAILLQDLR